MALRYRDPQVADNPDAPRLRDNGVTLDEMALVLGVSNERVRQIEVAALTKCRRWCDRHGFRLEDLLRR